MIVPRSLFRCGFAIESIAQAIDAFFSETLTSSGLIAESSGYKQLCGILDVGYRTTDFLIFENGQFIGEKEELSEDSGIRSILEKLQSYVKKKFDNEHLEFLEPVLRGEAFVFRGQEHDLSEFVAHLIAEHIHKRIEPEVLKRWEGRINRMHKIIICGGGAYFFKEPNEFLMLHKKQILIPKEPEMANAIGFYRYGVMQDALEKFKAKTG